ncbi:hypothetical protein BBJ28_00003207 [Nothophytophthora sp. Chile5]|nr:hypothetical protein BBJ28_00003207 [Nothophytophthora sp. Chile5]
MSGARVGDVVCAGAARSPPGPQDSPPRLATDVATQWLASMDAMLDDDGVEKPAASVSKREVSTSSPIAPADSKRADQLGQKRQQTEDDSGSASTSSEGPKKRAKRKFRKSTIDVRKEEKAHLLEELAELHTKMEELKSRAFATYVGVEARSPSEMHSANRVLRRAIQTQQLEYTQIHALMSEYSLFNIRVGSPIHRPMHLYKDEQSRREMLTGMKSKVLHDGATFLHDRRPRVDPCKPMREDHGYEAPNGDFYATYISTMQFDNTVQQVYDILLGYFSSIEISVSEKLGNITIREDDDNMAPGITQNRLVSTTIGGLRMESNTVYFSRYDEGSEETGHQNGYGIFVADFVDEDDRNPYHPHERIRRDFSAVLELTSYPIKHGVRTRSDSAKRGRVVVLTRWVHSKVHHPKYEIPLSGWHEMRENTERWIQTLHHTMMERLSPVLFVRDAGGRRFLGLPLPARLNAVGCEPHTGLAGSGYARQPLSQSLPLMASPVFGSAMRNNASASSSPSSSASSTAAEIAGPAQAWLALWERKSSASTAGPERGSAATERKALEQGELGRKSKKRTAEGEERPEAHGDEDTGSSVRSKGLKQPEKKRGKRKHRKATHTIRKEEKEQLLKEMELLNAKIADLKQRTRSSFDEEEELAKEQAATGRVLREGVQRRQQTFSEFAAIMSEYTLCVRSVVCHVHFLCLQRLTNQVSSVVLQTIQSGSPLQDTIYLRRDEQSRRDTLRALKATKLENAERFLKMRRPNLDPCNSMGEERRYEAENGDFCSTRFTVTQFDGAESVKQIFDLLLLYFCNIEISISEKIGHITIREDDGSESEGITQNRLVSITHKDVKMESNTVMFSQYFDPEEDQKDGRGEGGYGIFVADFVDDDERHPYRPDQRVRRDVNAVLEVRACEVHSRKPAVNGSPTQETVVILTSAGASSSATSSSSSSPVSDASVSLQRSSWASLLVPKANSSSADRLDAAVLDDVKEHRSDAEENTPRPSTRKRRGTEQLNGSEAAEERRNSDGGDTSAQSEAPQRPKQPKRKHRKGTHTIRKEKEQLLKEMEVLREEMAALKKRALNPNSEVGRVVRKSRRQTLREGVYHHQKTFCEALSIMSDYTLCNIQAGNPLQERIVLPNASEARQLALKALKAKKLADAERFLQLRRSNLDPCKALIEDQRYETENGDFCSTRFTAMQFEGVRSVKQVFDLLIFYFSHMEISVSEKLDNLVTIRENDDDSDNGITQNRLVSTTTTRGMEMESNTVMFSHFCEREDIPGSDQGYGLITSDFVDEDERYPYRPDERVRKDVTGVMEVRTFKRHADTESTQEETVVVVTRWEKEQLLEEMAILNSKLADLKHQAIASWSEAGHTMQEKEEARKLLRDGIQQQQLRFIEFAGIMSEFTFTNIQAGSPLQDTIFLKRERESRRQTLRGLKASKIQKGRHFLQLRRPSFDPRACVVEGQRFETDSGDICSTRFTVTQFKGVQSVRQVFDLLLFYFCNIEINISEKIGHITIREDDDNGSKSIIQNRLVSTTSRGVKMESNTIMFSQYFDDPGESEFGLIVVDFVDDDERHPYQPGRRVRKDVNAVMEVRECSRSGAETVVALTRWVQNRLHYPKFAVERDEWCELGDHMDLWGQTIHRTMIEGLHA